MRFYLDWRPLMAFGRAFIEVASHEGRLKDGLNRHRKAFTLIQSGGGRLSRHSSIVISGPVPGFKILRMMRRNSEGGTMK